MTCHEFKESITDYLEGQIAAERRLEIERHLDGCAACQLYLQQVRTTVSALGRLPALAPPDALRARVVEAFERRGSVAPADTRSAGASSRVLHELEALVRRRFGWALSGLALGASLLLVLTAEPGLEIHRPGLPRCLRIELIAGVVPALALLVLCALKRHRVPVSAFALIAASGAFMGQILLLALCPMSEARTHALVIHAGGVVAAMVLGALLGCVPVAPRRLHNR